MKHLFLIAIIIGLGILTRAESEYTVTSDGANKILKGLISRDMLENDTAFRWFHNNKASFVPRTEAVAVLREKATEVQFLVFAATWNEETKYIIPRFFALLDAAAVPPDQVTLIGVDHANHSAHHLSEDMHIMNLPTIIVLKEGKEVGRLSGHDHDPWDTTLTHIIQTKF